MSSDKEELKPSNSVELEVKATVLRPLADKFQELTRQIDSGEYKLPKTIEEAEQITERYIEQAWERMQEVITQKQKEARIDERGEMMMDALRAGFPDGTEFALFSQLNRERVESLQSTTEEEQQDDK